MELRVGTNANSVDIAQPEQAQDPKSKATPSMENPFIQMILSYHEALERIDPSSSLAPHKLFSQQDLGLDFSELRETKNLFRFGVNNDLRFILSIQILLVF